MGRSPGQMMVPVLVGLAVPEAHDVALDAGLLAVLERPNSSGATVTAQSPLPGHRLRRGGRVRIWALPDDDPGGGGYVFATPDPQPLTGGKPRG